MIRTYQLGACDRAEVLRYARCPRPTEEILALMEKSIAAMDGITQGKVCFERYPLLLREDDTADMGFAACRSVSLSRHLAGCSSVVLFAATLGLEPDRLIARTERISPAKAAMLQAVCTERIENLCDLFEADIRGEAEARGGSIRTRFSPGYGDVPLQLQQQVFLALKPAAIGLTLNGSLLMSPTKSVTAIIGEKAGGSL